MADRYGLKAPLLLTLMSMVIGNVLFGICRSLPLALLVRGLFHGGWVGGWVGGYGGYDTIYDVEGWVWCDVSIARVRGS